VQTREERDIVKEDREALKTEERQVREALRTEERQVREVLKLEEKQVQEERESVRKDREALQAKENDVQEQAYKATLGKVTSLLEKTGISQKEKDTMIFQRLEAMGVPQNVKNVFLENKSLHMDIVERQNREDQLIRDLSETQRVLDEALDRENLASRLRRPTTDSTTQTTPQAAAGTQSSQRARKVPSSTPRLPLKRPDAPSSHSKEEEWREHMNLFTFFMQRHNPSIDDSSKITLAEAITEMMPGILNGSGRRNLLAFVEKAEPGKLHCFTQLAKSGINHPASAISSEGTCANHPTGCIQVKTLVLGDSAIRIQKIDVLK
jgi:hypothetical protein